MLELNKIYNEDCMGTMAKMQDNFIDLTVTSPPYDNLRSYKNDIDKTWGEHTWKPIIEELYRVTKEGGVVVWVVGDVTITGSETGTSFRQALYFQEIGFNVHDTMIYLKNGTGACGSNYCYWQAFEYMFVFSKHKINTVNRIRDSKNKYAGKKRAFVKSSERGERSGVVNKEYGIRNNVWTYNVGFANADDKVEHSAVFPESLANDHIISWSNENDIVYDPFIGSGTTAKMAVLNNRRYIGSEISKEYCEIAEKRVIAAVNDKAQQLF